MVSRDGTQASWRTTADDSGTLVYLPKQKTLFTGDIGVFGLTPLNGSGHVAGLIETCDRILAMDVGTIVPRHGPVGNALEPALIKSRRNHRPALGI